jgi:urease accessory protein
VVIASLLPREPEQTIKAITAVRRDSAQALEPALHPPSAGTGSLEFRLVGDRTVVARAYAASPLRMLMPNNHGRAAWVYLASFGGGLVDGDRLDVDVDVGEGAAAFLGTQASTKIYRSPHGCAQRLRVRASNDATVAVLPDPVACFRGARYEQRSDFALGRGASLAFLDSYTCGRGARGERWEFDLYASRTTVAREGRTLVVDACRLDPRHGSIAERMGRTNVALSMIVVGPAFALARAAMLAPRPAPARHDREVVAASAIGDDGAILRVAADRFERASYLLRPSFDALASALGDDPFARKW